MTIFEMLEKLETEIVSLQARYQDLASSVGNLQANGNGQHPGSRKRGSGRKKSVVKAKADEKPGKRKAKPPTPVQAFEQLELPADEVIANQPAEGQPGRALGKRQALGKSIIQLRKMSAWRTGRSVDE